MNSVITKGDILQYKWLGRDEGYKALEHEIIFKDLCCGCGNCEAVCPENVIEVGEYPELVGKCTDCGYCLMQCPRSYFSREEAEEKLFGDVTDDPLGHVVKMVGVKAKGNLTGVQDGGFVTAALTYALKKGIIDGAVVSGVDKKNRWRPVARLATSGKEVAQASGTRYSNSPNLSVLKEAKEKGLKKLAVVGLPCQIEAVRKLENYSLDDVDLAGRIKFTIAIFCSSNFTYDGLMKRLVSKKYKVPLSKISKMDIKGKNVLVISGKKTVEIPLKEAYAEKREACKVCTDFSGKLSDISAGAVGAPDGYTAVFARSKSASKLLDEMITAGIFETVKLKDGRPGLDTARFLQNKKEKEAVSYTRGRVRGEVPLPFRSLKF
ncbi:MAG: Coenzyme F420 hydrogenase/dehydrogenase, beta subunit C-terminal domain [Candidatus Hydrothermarchaeaceae archaeon]